ncbi:MAG: hypothetical protein ABSG94_13020 [Brevinematales bacterium]
MDEGKILELDLLDLKSAAKSLGVSIFTFKRLLRENNTPVVKQGRNIMIKKSRIEEMFTLSEKPYNEVVKPRGKRGAKMAVKASGKKTVAKKALAAKKPGAKRGPKPKVKKAEGKAEQAQLLE